MEAGSTEPVADVTFVEGFDSAKLFHIKAAVSKVATERLPAITIVRLFVFFGLTFVLGCFLLLEILEADASDGAATEMADVVLKAPGSGLSVRVPSVLFADMGVSVEALGIVATFAGETETDFDDSQGQETDFHCSNFSGAVLWIWF